MQERNISKNTYAAADEPEDFAQAAADLMQKIEADKKRNTTERRVQIRLYILLSPMIVRWRIC